MTLESGARLGPYEVLSPLGSGGMGEVYRANDARLDREVAIKVLPAALSRDAERIARFQREAKVLALLNHPNIAAIYGFEEADKKKFLVMELVEGETLADRLKRGALTVEEALDIGKQMAEALEAAHERGVIHRDLKPANVKITPEGKVKVLDFGLAKAMAGESSPSPTEIANSPTITADFTRPGVVLGTAAYMSPEQARGKPLDKRTDIWSLGCILFEALTGIRLFGGETTSDAIGAILHKEPDWSLLPAGTPPTVHLLLRRCLAKDRQRRIRDAGDARVDIEMAIADPTSSVLLLAGAAVAGSMRRKGRRVLIPSAILCSTLLVGLALGWGACLGWKSAVPAPVLRFQVDAPAPFELSAGHGEKLNHFALSPGGTLLAFIAEHDGTSRLFLRDFAEREARALPGTESGEAPFFSPDGRWVGFFASGKLMKVPVGGGPPLTICDATGGFAAWLEDSTIIFTTLGGRSLLRVDERGGSPKQLAVAGPGLRAQEGEQLLLGFQTLHAVPGADYVLAGVWDGTTIEDYVLVAVSLADGAVRPVIANAVDPYFVAPRSLVFLRGSSVMATTFDATRGEVIGEPVQVIDGVISSKWADEGLFAVSLNGTLAYVPGGRQGPGRRLIRVDDDGQWSMLLENTDAIVGGLRVSPNGRDLILMTLRRNIDLWALNLDRRSLTLVNNVGESWQPVWTPDGLSVVFRQVNLNGPPSVVIKRVDGGGPSESVPLEGAIEAYPTSFSLDGRLLLATLDDVSPERRSDVALYRWGQSDAAEILLGSGADEGSAVFAPDGLHFAYVSDETGRYEVFVRTISGTGAKSQVSQTGGRHPMWARDGKRLFFLDHKGNMRAVTVDLAAGPRFSTPTTLFDTAGIATTDLWGVYDVFPDGGFVMAQPAEWEKEAPRIRVVFNWRAEVDKR